MSLKGTADAVKKLEILNPRMWDIDHPELYKAEINSRWVEGGVLCGYG
jgi:hypothetical protein